MKYHHESGPLHYDTAESLEEALGDELRQKYEDLSSRSLVSALSMRRKAVIVSRKAVRTWLELYRGQEAEPSRVRKRPAGIAVARKRPASAAQLPEPPMKRPAAVSAADQQHLANAKRERNRSRVWGKVSV